MRADKVDISKDIDLMVEVSIGRCFTLRLALGLWLMKLGARLLPFDAEVKRVQR